ncbi:MULTISPECIES: hypothetical protein [unclassified Moorena]|uniref:hypothetical protein n=1 Tax=unclassified Moorena TaxID=2683338 RepID=UPI001400E096|nr:MULTISPECIES: hypothetical protein [unclassified Moorena]NEO14949.1 hypothetical protein [Moorena sp. SIO3E8]NEQ01381.1 hypothetical protein [Moorena sp. SIO3F7]
MSSLNQLKPLNSKGFNKGMHGYSLLPSTQEEVPHPIQKRYTMFTSQVKML